LPQCEHFRGRPFKLCSTIASGVSCFLTRCHISHLNNFLIFLPSVFISLPTVIADQINNIDFIILSPHYLPAAAKTYLLYHLTSFLNHSGLASPTQFGIPFCFLPPLLLFTSTSKVDCECCHRWQLSTSQPISWKLPTSGLRRWYFSL